MSGAVGAAGVSIAAGVSGSGTHPATVTTSVTASTCSIRVIERVILGVVHYNDAKTRNPVFAPWVASDFANSGRPRFAHQGVRILQKRASYNNTVRGANGVTLRIMGHDSTRHT